MKNAILIAGPTASGKSALALRMAERHGGVVVNTDSMQVYSVLEVLTARPRTGDLGRAPHVLYGHVSPAEAYSAGLWQRDVAALVEAGAFVERRPIFTGGTGLYFKALTEGLSAMPEIPEPIRAHWRGRLAQDGPQALHAELARRDGHAAAQLSRGDSQRVVRALEVHDASGRSIFDWQGERGAPLIDRATARFIVMEPDRSELVRRIEERFDRMLDEGALEEARAIAALDLDPAQPALKAIGVRELIAADRGEIGFDEAIASAKAATRQYSKRQSTWFRNQFGVEWERARRIEELTS